MFVIVKKELKIKTCEYIKRKKELAIIEMNLEEQIKTDIIYYCTPKVKRGINSLKDNYQYDDKTGFFHYFCLESPDELSKSDLNYSLDLLLMIHFFMNKAMAYILTEKPNSYDLFKTNFQNKYPLNKNKLKSPFLFIDFLERHELQLPSKINILSKYIVFDWEIEEMQVAFINAPAHFVPYETFYYSLSVENPGENRIFSSSKISKIPEQIYEHLAYNLATTNQLKIKKENIYNEM